MKKFVVSLLTVMLVSVAVAQKSGDRIGLAFMAGIDGLGSTPMSGINTMNNAYGTRVWFNSWQVELNYKIHLSSKTKLHIGVGYESDGFKMDNNIVEMRRLKDGTGELVICDETACENPDDFRYYETRLITRYITIPVGINYKVGELTVGATLVAGINYTSRNTGLKYSYMNHTEYYNTDDIHEFIKPYKVDVRIEVLYQGFGVYCQIATRSLFRNTDRSDIYPLRAGFMIRL